MSSGSGWTSCGSSTGFGTQKDGDLMRGTFSTRSAVVGNVAPELDATGVPRVSGAVVRRQAWWAHAWDHGGVDGAVRWCCRGGSALLSAEVVAGRRRLGLKAHWIRRSKHLFPRSNDSFSQQTTSRRFTAHRHRYCTPTPGHPTARQPQRIPPVLFRSA
jgi:hypothetical protein